MSEDARPYVREDEHGALRVAETDVLLDSVLGSWEQGASPETIRRQFPSLSLENVYGAIAWSLGHAEQVAAYLKRQDARWQEVREGNDASPLVKRLRAAKAPTGRP
jgi:uncharacterized protein (DUF433 family)